MPATRPTATRAPRAHVAPPPPPSGSHTARLAVVSWTVVVSAGLAALGAAPAQRPTVPAVPQARPAAAPVYTVTAAAATSAEPAPPPASAVSTAPVTTGAADAAVAQMQSAPFTTALPDARARIAIATAMAQIGLPYVWGGNGPAAGDAGFDCSGLTTFSYAAAGVALPRTAQTQYYAGPHVPSGAALQPGDLVFYGTPARVHHVGMYIGAGRMVNAPTFGKPVQTAYYRWTGDDYLGATRPAATGTPLDGLLITVPGAASVGSGSAVFAAPSAPLPATPLPDPTVPQPPEADTAAAAVAKTDPPVVVAPAIPPTDQTLAAAPPASGTTAPQTGPAATSAPGTTTETAPPTTAPPTTPAEAAPTTTTVAPAPTTTTPPATTPPLTTPPTTTPATTTPPVAKPAPKPTTVTVAGTTVKVAAVGVAANGLPRANGLWSRAGRPVLRLSAGLVGAATTVTITHPDGSTDTYSVTSTATLSTAEAAQAVAGAASGELVLVAVAGDGSWTVVTAS